MQATITGHQISNRPTGSRYRGSEEHSTWTAMSRIDTRPALGTVDTVRIADYDAKPNLQVGFFTGDDGQTHLSARNTSDEGNVDVFIPVQMDDPKFLKQDSLSGVEDKITAAKIVELDDGSTDIFLTAVTGAKSSAYKLAGGQISVLA